MNPKYEKQLTKHSIAAGAGALAGAVSKSPLTPRPGCPVSAQVASATAAAAAKGAGVGGSLAAGAAVVTAKAAALTAAAPIALPVLAVGAAAFGLWKLFSED